jgi:aspartyl-tRNA synthetase
MAAAEYDEQAGTWHAAHHPFTRPTDDTVEFLKTDPSRARAVAYDLVGNGIELAGGSFRIHEPGLQQQVFANLGIGPEEQREKFGFLLDALAMGAPPHGGIASGIDRLLMALLAEERIRDTQAFPKNQVGYDYMTGAPIELGQEQLDELGIEVRAEAEAEAEAR